ncbi:MAG: hypothetical protein ABI914_03845, partial [Acidobacteriota bacterium]
AVVAVVLAGVLSAAFSWRTWILPFVDSPREMNVPARIVAGERLYRDVVYYYGPAGPWINAAAIAAFGRRFASLEAVGLCAAVLLFASLSLLTRRAGSGLAAFAACAWAAALCIGAPNGGSFLFPYSFGALWAFAGSFLALAAASGDPSRRARFVIAAGIALALLSKPEIGAALAAVLLVGGLRDAERGRFRHVALALSIGAAAAAAGWAIACAGLPLSAVTPEGPLALFSPPAEWRNVYRVMSGAADPSGSANRVATALFLDLAIAGAAAAAGSRAAERLPRVAIAAGVALCAAAAVLLSLPSGAAIEDRLPPLLAPMPLLCAIAALVLLRAPLDPRGRSKFLLFAFAAAAASRVLLGLAYGRVTTPYSILVFPGLAAAAAVLAIDGVAFRVPWPRGARVLFSSVFLAAGAVALARGVRLHLPERFPLVVTPAGPLRLPADRAAAISETAGYLQAMVRPGDGFAGFPEGGLFNFTLGLPNPLREEQVLPGHLDATREEEVARRIETAGPRFLVIANQPTAIFGPVAFGDDYARRIRAVIQSRYRLGATFGEGAPESRVGDPRFFIHVYERIGPEGARAPAPGIPSGPK